MIQQKKILALVTMSIYICWAGVALALPVTATLTGDPRAGNPDDLLVNVTVAAGSTNYVTLWTVDLASEAAHPDMKLDEFYFNLDVTVANVAFTDFDPGSWHVVSPATVQGAGGAIFTFEAGDSTNSGTDVTNSQDLTFTATRLDGNPWTDAMFTGAISTSPNDSVFIGEFQLGAHLQSLRDVGASAGDTEGSGFAVGNWVGGGGPSPGPNPIPEPATMLLFGTGLASLAGFRRKTKNKM